MPSSVDATVVEQRILEQSMRIRSYGAVTAWASLRWRGARYLDGRELGGRSELPVPLVVARNRLRGDPRVTVSQEQLDPREREEVAGVWVTTPARATFDEMRRAGTLRSAVVALDMAIAAGLVRWEDFVVYLVHRQAWTGVRLARSATMLASDSSASPMESLMRLCWILDAGLPPPMCNAPVLDRTGALIGVADLLDPEAGVVGEYDGAHHKHREQHRRDVDREARYRDHGLEYFTVVEGDLGNREAVARRMVRARSRARFLSPDSRDWYVAGAA